MQHLSKAHRLLESTAKKVLSSNFMNSVEVVMSWTELGNLPSDYDEHDLSTHAATSTEETLNFNAMVHYVNHGASTYQRFAEVESGDVILDVMADINIDNKKSPTFSIEGKKYSQKNIGGELASVWDSRTKSGNSIFRTLLLKPAS